MMYYLIKDKQNVKKVIDILKNFEYDNINRLNKIYNPLMRKSNQIQVQNRELRMVESQQEIIW